MKSIVWLASYPKSGNTWFRAFLTHLLIRGTKHEFDINKLVCRMHSSRSFLDDALELDSSMLSAREILELMPEVYIHYANETAERIYFKSHEKRYHVAGGRWNIPAEVTEKALYFVRNPLEVAVSYAHHNQVTID